MWSQLLVFFFCFLDLQADSEADSEADLEAALAVDATLFFRGVAVEGVTVEGVTLGRGGEGCSRLGSVSLCKVQLLPLETLIKFTWVTRIIRDEEVFVIGTCLAIFVIAARATESHAVLTLLLQYLDNSGGVALLIHHVICLGLVGFAVVEAAALF